MSSLLRDSHSPLAEKLDTIASVTVAVVCLEYEGTVLPEDYREVRCMLTALSVVLFVLH